jgi:hypothetical protein
MNKQLHWIVVGLWCSQPLPVFAAQWTKVTENAVSDRFFVDTSSIQRKGAAISYWEYREFPQPNNALLETAVTPPVHGVVMRWALNCSNKTQRLERLNAYDKSRKIIRKFDYGTKGDLVQPQPGSSSFVVMNFVCNPKDAAKPESSKPEPVKPGAVKPGAVKPGAVKPK